MKKADNLIAEVCYNDARHPEQSVSYYERFAELSNMKKNIKNRHDNVKVEKSKRDLDEMIEERRFR